MMKLSWVPMVLMVVGCQASEAGSPNAAAVARLSLPAGARVVAPAAADPGTRVATQACVAGQPGVDVANAVRASLVADWGNVQIIPAQVPGRWILVGAQGGSGVSGVVDEARRGPCADGEVYVSLGVNDIPPEPAGVPRTSAGPRGVAAATSGRAPVLLTPVTK